MNTSDLIIRQTQANGPTAELLSAGVAQGVLDALCLVHGVESTLELAWFDRANGIVLSKRDLRLRLTNLDALPPELLSQLESILRRYLPKGSEVRLEKELGNVR